MGEYDRQVATALRLIAKKGQAVVWRRLSLNITDETKPWKPGSDTAVDENVRIVFLPIGRVGNESTHKMENAEVSTGTEKGLMGAQSFEPSDKDVVIRGSEILRIKSIDTLKPNGQVILHTIEFDE